MDEPTHVVMTETQKELLEEIHAQYTRKRQVMEEQGINPDLTVGKLHLFLPYEMLREAFAGEPPAKEA